MVKFQGRFLPAGRVPVEERIAGELKFMHVDDMARGRRLTRELEVHYPGTSPNQVDDADQSGQTVARQVSFDTDLDRLGLLVGLDGCLVEVMLQGTPR